MKCCETFGIRIASSNKLFILAAIHSYFHLAISENNGHKFTLVVRDCVVDNGGTNSETEIGRQSHCGWMKVLQYNGERMRGCILSCDLDGCNVGGRLTVNSVWILTLLFLYSLLHWNNGVWSLQCIDNQLTS